MNFTHYDIGWQSKGTVIEITLKGSAANVRLMNNSNFQSYKSGRSHRYQGGLVKRSPVRLAVPSSGHWYVTVDMAGLSGNARSSVRILPGPLPEIRQTVRSPLAPLVQGSSGAFEDGIVDDIPREHDVFISHASDDKEAIVRPLANALREAGLNVWYDEFELRIGDSLRRKIDAGLANSRFGVVVLSHAFFAKNWTQYELDGLVTREMTGKQIILPLWHNITRNELIRISPSLADKMARSTSDYTIQQIADEIASVINE